MKHCCKAAKLILYSEELLSGFIPAPYFGFPKRALRNHADCLQPLENYLASPKAEIILLRSAKKILAQGKALEEWRCSRKTVRKYLLRPVQALSMYEYGVVQGIPTTVVSIE